MATRSRSSAQPFRSQLAVVRRAKPHRRQKAAVSTSKRAKRALNVFRGVRATRSAPVRKTWGSSSPYVAAMDEHTITKPEPAALDSRRSTKILKSLVQYAGTATKKLAKGLLVGSAVAVPYVARAALPVIGEAARTAVGLTGPMIASVAGPVAASVVPLLGRGALSTVKNMPKALPVAGHAVKILGSAGRSVGTGLVSKLGALLPMVGISRLFRRGGRLYIRPMNHRPHRKTVKFVRRPFRSPHRLNKIIKRGQPPAVDLLGLGSQPQMSSVQGFDLPSQQLISYDPGKGADMSDLTFQTAGEETSPGSVLPAAGMEDQGMDHDLLLEEGGPVAPESVSGGPEVESEILSSLPASSGDLEASQLSGSLSPPQDSPVGQPQVGNYDSAGEDEDEFYDSSSEAPGADLEGGSSFSLPTSSSSSSSQVPVLPELPASFFSALGDHHPSSQKSSDTSDLGPSDKLSEGLGSLAFRSGSEAPVGQPPPDPLDLLGDPELQSFFPEKFRKNNLLFTHGRSTSPDFMSYNVRGRANKFSSLRRW